MEADDSVEESAIDKTKIPPLHQKRTLAFVNHFLITNCTFLNEFAIKCETKFIELERKLQKVEAALIILESKLDSIPNDVDIKGFGNREAQGPEPRGPGDNRLLSEDSGTSYTQSQIGVRACEDGRFTKYFRMLQVGVPSRAVKIKMILEGLNSDILDTPELVLTDGVNATEK